MFFKKKRNTRDYFISYFYYDAEGEKRYDSILFSTYEPVLDMSGEFNKLEYHLKMLHQTEKIYFLYAARI